MSGSLSNFRGTSGWENLDGSQSFYTDIFDSLHGYATEVRKFKGDINIDLPCLGHSQTSGELPVGRTLTVPRVSIQIYLIICTDMLPRSGNSRAI